MSTNPKKSRAVAKKSPTANSRPAGSPCPSPVGASYAFIPPALDCSDFAQLEPLYKALQDRPLNSPAELERWLADFSDLSAAVSEYGSRCRIDQSCHTDDPGVEKKFLHYVEKISPRIEPLYFALQKKYHACPHRTALRDAKFDVLGRQWTNEVELFRPENIPLQTELTKLNSEYDKLCGAMLVDFQGRQYTLQQLARFGEEQDRSVRQEAWLTAEARRRQDREAIETVFDKQLEIRGRVAKNADCADFRGYMWKSYCRFDYSPEDCLEFARAIAETCLPVIEKLNDRRRRQLGLSLLRPWDSAVDPLGRPPLRPFREDDIADFVARTTGVFDRISPALGKQFRELRPGRNLDLDSRKGKRPGGYQSSLEVVRQPFIFMNAAGLQRDVETMLHEGGHAFHYQAARAEPLLFVRHAPIEFCEVASMSMELLGDDHLDVFYDDRVTGGEVKSGRGKGKSEEGAEDGKKNPHPNPLPQKGEGEALRAKRTHLEGIVRIMPWIATIDSFQHWLYTHTGHRRADRAAAWLDIHRRFSSELVDWHGYEDVRSAYWQRQIHLFHYPFYYVEYGIAQLGALGVWLNYRRDPVKALAQLQAAFALGGTRPLPELFRTAGIPFDFSRRTLEPLMAAVGEELAKLGE